jgi:hypothetical protein
MRLSKLGVMSSVAVAFCADIFLMPTSTRGDIYVASFGSNTIGDYSPTGAAVHVSLVSGLNGANGLALSGSNLFVTNDNAGTIGEYNTSGGILNASLITGLSYPQYDAVSGSNLFVANWGTSTLGKYNTSGSTVSTSAASGLANPIGIAISGSLVFVANSYNGTVGEYNTSGGTINASLITGLNGPNGIAVSGTDLFVSFGSLNKIAKYNTSGILLNSNFITGLSGPWGLAVSGSDLFVTNGNSGTIGEYTTAGAVINAALVSGLNAPRGIAVVLSSNWNVPASGDWNVSSNWDAGVPNGIDTTANLSSAAKSSTVVFTTAADTVGTLNFNNSNTYQVTGTGSLTLQVSSGTAGINVLQAGTQEINLPLTIASNTVFNVSNGANLVIANPVTINSGISLTKTGGGTVTYQSIITLLSGASMSLASPVNANSLILGTSSSATISSHGSGSKNTLQLDSLTLASTALLNLNNNDLIVHGGSISTVTSEVATGYNGGQWNGNGVMSGAAASDSTHLTALGTIQNSVNGNQNGTALYTSFDEVSVISTDVLVKYTYYGDTNLDGKVDGSDYTRIDNGYLTHASGWFNGDFNYDGVINGSDYTLIDNAFNTQGAQLTAQVAVPTAEIAASSAVPEPIALPMLGFAAAMLSRRRRVNPA